MDWHQRHHNRQIAPGRAALIEALAAFLERDLQLSSAQKPAWQALTRDARAALAETHPLPEEVQDRPASALQQLEDMRQLFTGGLSALDRVEPSFRTFYAVLDGRQRARVDAALSHRRPW